MDWHEKRCYNENCDRFKDYGGRGIKVCDAWKDSFNTFSAWALANGYESKLTLDRIDNNGDYEPDNCRWATYTEQNNNSRHNRIVTINGVSKNLKQWSDYYNIDYKIVRARLSKGWDEVRALTQEVKHKSK